MPTPILYDCTPAPNPRRARILLAEKGIVPAETISAAGSGQVAHVLLDHYFTSSMRRLYAYAGGGWRYRNVAATDEQGVAQVAFSSTRVDAWWDGANTITIMRCWKTF